MELYHMMTAWAKIIDSYVQNGSSLECNCRPTGESEDKRVTLRVVYSYQAEGKSTMEVIQAKPSEYEYLILSPYSRLQEPKKGKEGLSAGSILCIIFVVLVFVYFVGGFVFCVVVQHKSGREAIPNYSFWIEVPGLIKEGATFTVSVVTGKGGSSSPAYQDATSQESQDGEDAFSGRGSGTGGSGGSSTGKTAYDAI